jgi:O-antigen ligase
MRSCVPDSGAPALAATPPGALWAGAPLRSTLAFLVWPVLLVVVIKVFEMPLPVPLLYALALVYGAVLALRSLRNPEALLAVFILYIPMQRQYVVPIASGINGTNALLLLLLLAWLFEWRRRGGSLHRATPATKPVLVWMALSGLSFLTAAGALGISTVAADYKPTIKAWLDPFLIFFAVANLIRDGAMARRMVVYMMLGAFMVLTLGFVEWLDKRTLSSIEKARLLGPQLQPNDFAAFLVYSAAPFIGLFFSGLARIRAWLLVGYFVLLLRIVLATFSRAGYLALAAATAAACFVRGKLFLAVVAAAALGVLTAFPEIVPDSLQARMAQSNNEDDGTLDSSSQTRLILWKAAIEMTKESPLLGKGLGMFPRLKRLYTEVDVEESDNHNMFLFITSQMGVPALLAFLFIFYRMFRMGVGVARASDEVFLRGIGIGAAALVASIAVINMFGTRMADASTMAYVWIYLAVLSRLWAERVAPQPARVVIGRREGLA